MSIELFKSDLKKFEQELTHQSLTEIYLQYQEWPLSKEEPEQPAFKAGLRVKLTPMTCSDYWQLLKEYDEKFIGLGYCKLFKLLDILLGCQLLIKDDFHIQFFIEFYSAIVRFVKHHKELMSEDTYMRIYREHFFIDHMIEIKQTIENDRLVSKDDLDRWFATNDYFGCLDPNIMYHTKIMNCDTIFSYLAISGQLESLKYLVSLEPSIGDVDIHGIDDLPFGAVCANDHLDVAKYMISLESTHGNIDIFEDGGAFFRWAAKKGQLEILKYLMELASHRIIDFRREVTLQEIIDAAESANQSRILKYLRTEVPRKIAEIDPTIKVPEYVNTSGYIPDDIYRYDCKYIKSITYQGKLDSLKEITSREDFLTQIELNNLTLQDIFQAAADGEQYKTFFYLHKKFPEVNYLELNIRRATKIKIIRLFRSLDIAK